MALPFQNPSVKLGERKKVKLGRALADVDSDSPLFVDALGDQGRRRVCAQQRRGMRHMYRARKYSGFEPGAWCCRRPGYIGREMWIGGSVRTGEVAIDGGKSSSDPPLKDRTIGSEVVVTTIRGLPSCDYFDRV
ncbi:hypothetical protein Bbelb_075750 [Branchiostoma belcheri]|nr:hypothetical protein Bbelb_075750 [Branchiostoma belcheri]